MAKKFGESQLYHSTNRWRVITESFNSIKEVKVFNFSKHLESFFYQKLISGLITKFLMR